jgi:Ran GTPase-activating protein (RanGAP) involved in mRNA processing and transport
MSGVIALANTIKDMKALSVTNVMGNKIGKEQLAKLQEIMRSKPNLVSLCGIADDATEADLSALGMDDDDAIVLASELPDKGAMSKLSLSYCQINHRLKGEKAAAPGKALADALAATTSLRELDLSGNVLKPEFARELAVGLEKNQTLSALDLSYNAVGSVGAEAILNAVKLNVRSHV